MVSKARINSLTGAKVRAGITQYMLPDVEGGWRDIYRAGWRPAWFNQTWGGAQWGTEQVDGPTGQVFKFDVATGYIADTAQVEIFNTAGRSQGFKVSETQQIAAMWLKLYRKGVPASSLQPVISADDGTGKPNGATVIANGTANAISPRTVTSSAEGEWVRVTFPTPPTLNADTRYHIVLRNTAPDNTNCFVAKADSASAAYPHGILCNGDATPTWSAVTAWRMCFMLEPVAGSQFLRNAGRFSAQLVFAEGAPIDQSRALLQPLRNFFDGKLFTALHRVSSCQKGKPIADYVYGFDHDRIALHVNSVTGYPELRVWTSDGTLYTYTGNVDVSGVALSDIGIAVRAMGDGADYIDLWVNGARQIKATGLSLSFDMAMSKLGHGWMGGGFTTTPGWTQKADMASLPSAGGWTWTGAGVEANQFSVQGGKLYQNKFGFGANDYGSYRRDAAGFSNAIGGAVVAKTRALDTTNTKGATSIELSFHDGARGQYAGLQSYFGGRANATTWLDTYQHNFRLMEHVVALCGKGDDTFIIINGRPVYDGTGANTAASAINAVWFGDNNGNANENASAIWDYAAYKNNGPVLPQGSTGMALHEYAFWSGDRSDVFSAAYNEGTPISIKELAGLDRNYARDTQWAESRRGITNQPANTSPTPVVMPEMEAFVIGDRFTVDISSRSYGADVHVAYVQARVDGALLAETTGSVSVTSASAEVQLSANEALVSVPLGLHKVDAVHYVSTGTHYLTAQHRTMNIRSVPQ